MKKQYELLQPCNDLRRVWKKLYLHIHAQNHVEHSVPFGETQVSDMKQSLFHNTSSEYIINANWGKAR